CSWDTLVVQHITDRLQRQSAPTHTSDPLRQLRRDRGRAAEPDASSLLRRETLTRSQADDPTLPLGDAGHDAGDKLAGGRREIKTEIERDEVPAIAARAFEQTGEVDQ